MTLFLPAERENKKLPNGVPYRVIGYREYPTQAKVWYADENLKNFRNLLFRLKEGNTGAIGYFLALLCMIYDEVLDGPQLIACVPGSKGTDTQRSDPLALVARQAAKELDVLDGASLLQRTHDVPKAHEHKEMRCYPKQLESITCGSVNLKNIPKSILIIDDIYTSGVTMGACCLRIHEAFPEAKLTVFAFGRTPDFLETPSPVIPAFPSKTLSEDELPEAIEELRSEAWPCIDPIGTSPFYKSNWFVHRNGVVCGPAEQHHEKIWSKAQAEKNGLTPCRNCLPFERKNDFWLNFTDMSLHFGHCGNRCRGWAGGKRLWSIRHGVRLGGKRNGCPCMRWWPLPERVRLDHDR